MLMPSVSKSENRPPEEGLLGHLPAFNRDPLSFLSNCARDYQGVVPLRMAHMPVYLLLNPADIERVLISEHRNFIKPAWLRTPAVQRLLGNGLVTAEDQDWNHQRHCSQPAFLLRRMGSYGDKIALISCRMRNKWTSGQSIDLLHEMALLTLEVVGNALFGIEANDWCAEASASIDVLMGRFAAGLSLYGMIPWPPGYQEIRASQRLNRVADDLIRKHRAEYTDSDCKRDPTDLLAMFRADPPAQNPTAASALREQVKTFLAAGYESSSLTLTWALLLLASHPDIENKISAELNSVLHGQPPAHEHLPKLQYTQAVIQETLRIYPPLWMTGRQPLKRCEIGGVSVPAGAMLMTSQWAVQRDPKLFTNPEEFRPERWLGDETANLPRCAYFPFGAGPRVCIAQNFAMMETMIILAVIVSKYRIEISSGQNITPCPTMTLRPPKGVRVLIHNRDAD